MPTVTGIATSFIDFTRASNATVTDSDGKVKWAPHNLLLNSESFDASYWGKQQLTVTANSIAAPNGTTTADTIVEDTTTNWHYINKNITFAAGVTYTASAFLKAGTQTYGTINIYNSSGVSLYAAASFNLSTGAVANSGVAGTGYSIVGSPSITPIGSSGWYLCSLTFVAGTTAPEYFTISTSDNGVLGSFGMTSYLGASKTIYAWGAALYRSDLAMQANTSAYPMYNPTTVKNLLGYTDDITNTAWTNWANAVTVTANAATAPNGLQTADALLGNGTANVHYTSQAITLASTGVYVMSCYAKANGVTALQFFTNGSGSTGQANFNLASGAVGTSAAPFSSLTITPVGSDGWYRCSAVISSQALTNIYYSLSDSPSAARAPSFTTSGGIYLWGAQLSDSASLDPYVPVYGAAVTSAAYYGPRRDFDGSTLACKGLLVEEQRANLVLNSAAFDDGSWFTGGTTVSANVSGATAVTPSGTNTAEKLAEDNSTGTHRILPVTALTVVSGSPYTYSVYAKAVERTKIVITDNDIQGATFDLSAGTVSALGTGVTAPPPVAVGNGWYRCVMTRSPSTTSGRIGIYLADGTGATSYTGVTGNGVLIWGAQVEAGSFATSYIPTGSANATRTADVASVSTQAFPYSSTEGTLVVAWQLAQLSGSPAAIHLTDVAESNRIRINAYLSGINRSTITAAGSLVDNIDTSSAATGITKYALGGKSADYAVYRNGSAGGTSTNAGFPSGCTEMRIGRDGATGNFNGHIRQITYIPRRLANAELQTRTS